MTELDRQEGTRILSVREKQVLSLIDRGLTSKRDSRDAIHKHKHGEPSQAGDLRQAAGEELD